MNSPSEERVMRAREVGSRLLQDRVWAEARERFLNDATQQDFENHLIRVAGEHAAMLTFADEGSGIGKLREARTACERVRDESRHAEFEGDDYRRGFQAGANGCALAILEMLNALASPDIDRSGLAQEVEQSRADQLLADDLDYVAGKPVE